MAQVAVETVGAVVGQNLERLRKIAGLTQQETSRLCSRRGVRLSRSKIAALEAGERPNPSFADVVLLADVFQVPVGEFFQGTGLVSLADDVIMSRGRLKDKVEGTDGMPTLFEFPPERRRWELIRRAEFAAHDNSDSGRWPIAQSTWADQSLAQRLNVATEAVVDVAMKLWGRTLTDERDARVDDFAPKPVDGPVDVTERQAHRGHVTRALGQEIRAELEQRGLITNPLDDYEEEEQGE